MMTITSIQKWGNSSGVRLHKRLLRAAKLKESDEVELIAGENTIMIRKVQRFENLDQLFAGYQGGYQPHEWQTGADLGREVVD